MKKDDELVYQLANEHWMWHERFLREVMCASDNELKKFRRIAIDYFLHGYKHGEKAPAPSSKQGEE